jgi:hypothetical protein
MRAAPESKTGQGRDLFPRAHDCFSTNRDSSGDTSNAAVLGLAHRGGIDCASSPLAVSRAIILRHMRRDVDGNAGFNMVLGVGLVRAGRDAMEGRSKPFPASRKTGASLDRALDARNSRGTGNKLARRQVFFGGTRNAAAQILIRG